jgi:hypothetical protein
MNERLSRSKQDKFAYIFVFIFNCSSPDHFRFLKVIFITFVNETLKLSYTGQLSFHLNNIIDSKCVNFQCRYTGTISWHKRCKKQSVTSRSYRQIQDSETSRYWSFCKADRLHSICCPWWSRHGNWMESKLFITANM